MQSGMYYYQQGQMYHILSKPINCCAIPIACLSAVYLFNSSKSALFPFRYSDSTSTNN